MEIGLERRMPGGGELAGGRSLSSEFDATPSVLDEFYMIQMA
jgi:hypothetical protein